MHLIAAATAVMMMVLPSLAAPPNPEVLWTVYFYEDGKQCQGEPKSMITGYKSMTENQYCASTTVQPHDVKAEGIAAAGKTVMLYSDDGCFKGVTGRIDEDGCHISPESAPIAAITVIDK